MKWILIAFAGIMISIILYMTIQNNEKNPFQGDIALSYEEAIEMCKDLNLTFDETINGYTTLEFCVE